MCSGVIWLLFRCRAKHHAQGILTVSVPPGPPAHRVRTQQDTQAGKLKSRGPAQSGEHGEATVLCCPELQRF